MLPDVLILGGGAIGLSTAYAAALRGRRVRVIERCADVGRESSWAGAGIVPPGVVRPGDPPLRQLFGHSYSLHVEWSQRLRGETGIDNGLRRCGAVYLAEDDASWDSLQAEVGGWRDEGIRFETLASSSLTQFEPALHEASAAGRFRAAYHLPDESQVRNPRHVRALAEACAARGVEIVTSAPVEKFLVGGGRIVAVETLRGSISAGQYCLCGGAWSGELGKQLGLNLAVRPIRGQIVLLAPPQPIIRGIVYAGRKYFVARGDGRVLVGSTEEDVGFDKSNTAEAIDDLLAFAYRTAPALREAPIEKTWAGLRPFSADGLPYLGRVPTLENAFVAAGHYRWGLALSPATGVVMSQSMAGEPTLVDLTPFRIDR